MKKILIFLSFTLLWSIGNAQENNTTKESNTAQKQEIQNKEVLKTNKKSVQNFNTDKIQLNKVQSMKYRMEGGLLKSGKSPEAKTAGIKPQSTSVESDD